MKFIALEERAQNLTKLIAVICNLIAPPSAGLKPPYSNSKSKDYCHQEWQTIYLYVFLSSDFIRIYSATNTGHPRN